MLLARETGACRPRPSLLGCSHCWSVAAGAAAWPVGPSCGSPTAGAGRHPWAQLIITRCAERLRGWPSGAAAGRCAGGRAALRCKGGCGRLADFSAHRIPAEIASLPRQWLPLADAEDLHDVGYLVKASGACTHPLVCGSPAARNWAKAPGSSL